ncbi:uncharacterized protein LOC116621204 isoform X2 [Nematostella vectensis]|uniref:uncharacterized protein LOC116621204 isoform X2 n=1 Tax=Nematostella vectensis TaxID=45351 RepID=UPI00207795E7|nr:uncharacterized protein LOC116621204 isoform X2 [Nematostella vectensis]
MGVGASGYKRDKKFHTSCSKKDPQPLGTSRAPKFIGKDSTDLAISDLCCNDPKNIQPLAKKTMEESEQPKIASEVEKNPETASDLPVHPLAPVSMDTIPKSSNSASDTHMTESANEHPENVRGLGLKHGSMERHPSVNQEEPLDHTALASPPCISPQKTCDGVRDTNHREPMDDAL